MVDATFVVIDLGYSAIHPECPAEPGGPVERPEWLEILSHCSLAITSLFLIEIPLTLWSLGFQFLNPWGPVPHAWLHLFDAVVIVTTFSLEVALRGQGSELAGLLIILRLWRIVKLVAGTYSNKYLKCSQRTVSLTAKYRNHCWRWRDRRRTSRRASQDQTGTGGNKGRIDNQSAAYFNTSETGGPID